jgi:hypothetical protein
VRILRTHSSLLSGFLLGVMGRDGYPDCARYGMRLRVQVVAPTIPRVASWIGYLLLAPLLLSQSSPAPQPPLPLLCVVLDCHDFTLTLTIFMQALFFRRRRATSYTRD